MARKKGNLVATGVKVAVGGSLVGGGAVAGNVLPDWLASKVEAIGGWYNKPNAEGIPNKDTAMGTLYRGAVGTGVVVGAGMLFKGRARAAVVGLGLIGVAAGAVWPSSTAMRMRNWFASKKGGAAAGGYGGMNPAVLAANRVNAAMGALNAPAGASYAQRWAGGVGQVVPATAGGIGQVVPATAGGIGQVVPATAGGMRRHGGLPLSLYTNVSNG